MKILPPRTIYQKNVKAPHSNMLKPGKNNKKLGGKVSVKMWQGKPLFSLTLEERKTCPTTCEQWDTCYGRSMPFAHRFDHTSPDFLPLLEEQLDTLLAKHEQGVVVRLHVLGDFYSEEYVEFWERKIMANGSLSVYGYTHHDPHSLIGNKIGHINATFPDQFNVRWSDDPDMDNAAIVYKEKEDVPLGQVICPEQLGATPSCADCGLCWAMKDRPVAFLEH